MSNKFPSKQNNSAKVQEKDDADDKNARATAMGECETQVASFPREHDHDASSFLLLNLYSEFLKMLFQYSFAQSCEDDNIGKKKQNSTFPPFFLRVVKGRCGSDVEANLKLQRDEMKSSQYQKKR